MSVPSLQQALASSPVLVIFLAFLVGLIGFFIIRFVFQSLGCLIHALIAIGIAVLAYLLLRSLIF